MTAPKERVRHDSSDEVDAGCPGGSEKRLDCAELRHIEAVAGLAAIGLTYFMIVGWHLIARMWAFWSG